MNGKAILFDIGSTLVMGPRYSPNKKITEILGLPDAQSPEIAKIIMRTKFANVDEVCYELNKSYGMNHAKSQKIKDLWLEQERGVEEIPGATETVLFFKGLGFKVGLISDIWVPYFNSFKHACPKIVANADCLTLSFVEGIKKPSTELVNRALNCLNEKPENTIMVGDTYTEDMSPAIQLGLKTVWVLSRIDREKDSIINVLNGFFPKPDQTISNINDTRKLISKTNI
ncbi:MAG: HAD hydrolase-like protein [Firmicutes bacterium]|nr:HAD hydrolase-like protein [Bacillota bacterium]